MLDNVKEIHIEPTSLCNANCPMCARTVYGEKLNPYIVLGVKPSDDIKEIRKKYINLSKTYHPDLLINKGVPEEVLEKSKEKMRIINNAWDQIQKLKKTS